VSETVRWLEVDRERRRRVARAARKGRATDDPHDAPYAFGFADASLAWLSWKRRFRPLHLLLFVLVLTELTLTGGWRPALIFYPLVGFTFLRLRAPRVRKRLLAARAANAEVASEYGLPPVTVTMPGHLFFRPGSRVRRRAIRSLVLALVGVLALAVLAAVWAIGQNHRWATDANHICLRERGRIAALPAPARNPIGVQERRAAIEEDALAAFHALDSSTRAQRNYIAWREYEVKLDVWLVGEMEAGDGGALAVGSQRLNSARDYLRKLARRLGAKRCARR
jgi:hypothetical protein